MKMPRKIPGNVRNKEGSVDLHYTEKRQKNNDAVKKSREKTRQKAKETMEKVTQLKQVINMFILLWTKFSTNVSFPGEWDAWGEDQVAGEGADISERHLHGTRRVSPWYHRGRHGNQGLTWGGWGEPSGQMFKWKLLKM